MFWPQISEPWFMCYLKNTCGSLIGTPTLAALGGALWRKPCRSLDHSILSPLWSRFTRPGPQCPKIGQIGITSPLMWVCLKIGYRISVSSINLNDFCWFYDGILWWFLLIFCWLMISFTIKMAGSIPYFQTQLAQLDPEPRSQRIFG